MFTEQESKQIRKQLMATKPESLDIGEFVGLYRPLLDSMFEAESIGTSRTTATDTLSVWILRATQKPDPQIMQAISEEDANRIFDFVLNFWIDSGVALGNALKELFRKLINLTSKKGDNKQVLYQWTDRVMGLPYSLRVHHFMVEILLKHVGARYIIAQDPEYPDHILEHIDSNGLASLISKTLFSMCSNLRADSEMSFEDWVEFWAGPVRRSLVDEKRRNNLQTYFLVNIFKYNPNSFDQFIRPLTTNSSNAQELDITIYLGCLQLGQNLNIDVHKSVSIQLLDGLLKHNSRALRVNGLSLLVSSPKVAKPVDSNVYDIVIASLDSLLIDIDSGYRNQILACLRQFVFRVRAYSYALSRDIKRNDPTAEEKLQRSQLFLLQLFDYVKQNLRPGTPYHSIFPAIQLFMILIESGVDNTVDKRHFEKTYIPFAFRIPLFTSESVRLLINTMTNNYEDVRTVAANILRTAPLPLETLTSTHEIDELADKGRQLVSGMRGREGDSGARVVEMAHRLYQADGPVYLETVVDEIEQNLATAETNLAVAVRKHSVHGYFIALKFIFEQKPQSVEPSVVRRVIDACHRVWPVVEKILCDDAPEGNIPQELESGYRPELESKYGLASQIVSSYSWRAVKDAALLIKTLIESLPDHALPDDLIVESGELMITQLVSVRHKGAFAAVYPAFVACCRKCNDRPTLQGQAHKWLQQNIDSIKSHARYITRRSGGLPYVTIAVLVADAQPQLLIERVFEQLLSIAKEPAMSTGEDKTNLPQVHAFNYIKTFLSEAEMSKFVPGLIERSLELAIKYFDHEIWSVRNCAVMLYTALQSRLFGSKSDSQTSARVFFTRHKHVRPLLLEHLQNHVDHLAESDKHVESVYPVLALLARLHSVDGYDGLEEFKPLVLECLKSRIWKVREMAARTLSSLVMKEQTSEFSKQLLERATIEKQNELHGHCLALACLRPELDVEALESNFEELLVNNPCPDTKLAFLRVVVICAPQSTMLKEYCQLHCFEALRGLLNPAARMLKQEMAKHLLELSYSTDEKLIENCLFSDAYEVQQEALRYLESSNLSSSSIAQMLWRVFEESQWDQVRGPAARIFSHICDASSFEKIGHCWNVLQKGTSNSSTDVNEPCIESLGFVTSLLPDKTPEWFETVQRFADENQAYPTRLAALNSLVSFIRSTNGTPDCKVLIALWRFLSDDDPDLREYAGAFVSEYLETGKLSIPHAENLLFDHISKYPEAYHHWTDMLLGQRPLKQQLKESLEEDELLFSIEKPNMYRNEMKLLERLYNAVNMDHRRHQQSTKAAQIDEAIDFLNNLQLTDAMLSKMSEPDVYLAVSRINMAAKAFTG